MLTLDKHTHASMHLIMGVMSLWTRTPRPAPVCRAPKTTNVSLAASRQETPSTPPWGRTAVQHGVEPCKKNSPVCICRSLGKRKGVLHQPARLPGVCARVQKVDLLWRTTCKSHTDQPSGPYHFRCRTNGRHKVKLRAARSCKHTCLYDKKEDEINVWNYSKCLRELTQHRRSDCQVQGARRKNVQIRERLLHVENV